MFWLCLPDRLQLARMSGETQNPEELRVVLERQLAATRGADEQSAIYRRLARVALQSGDAVRALQHARSATGVAPRSIRAWLDRAALEETLGRPADQEDSLEHAVALGREARARRADPELDRALRPARRTLAWLQRVAQHLERARDTYREIVRDDPSDARSAKLLAALEAELVPARAPATASPASDAPAPWATVPDRPGPVLRRVLALYKRSEGESAAANRIAAALELPLAHLGLIADFHAVEDGLPPPLAMTGYRGVMTWFSTEAMPDATRYVLWLAAQEAAGRRVVMMDRVGCTVDARTGRPLPSAALELLARAVGLRPARTLERRPGGVTVLACDVRMCELERALGREADTFADVLSLDPRARVHLALGLAGRPGARCDAVITGPRGGFCLDGYAIWRDAERHRDRWRLDPFRFLAQALAVEHLPRPDFTTRDGQRIVYAQVDGRGLDRACVWMPLHVCSDVFRSHVQARRELKWTVSLQGGRSALGTRGCRMDPNCPSILQLRPPWMRVADGFAFAAAPPFDGGSGAVRTFEATGEPRRLLPVDLRVQFDLLATRAGARWLDDVLDWIESARLAPVTITEMRDIVRGFADASVERLGSDRWRVSRMGRCLSVRFDRETRTPDLARCHGVTGFSRHGGALYVHLAPGRSAEIELKREVSL